MTNAGDKHTASRDKARQKNLHDCVEQSLTKYFKDLDGHTTKNLYALFLSEVEKPLYTVVMKHARGSLTRAAELLGQNRATLKKRLKKYKLD